ncbi:hypothetical protein SCARD494_11868 [Seiridium cardinale]
MTTNLELGPSDLTASIYTQNQADGRRKDMAIATQCRNCTVK